MTTTTLRPFLPALLLALACACSTSESVPTQTGDAPPTKASPADTALDYCGGPPPLPDVPPCPQCTIDKGTGKLTVQLDGSWVSQQLGGTTVNYQLVSADVELTSSTGATTTCAVEDLRMSTSEQTFACTATSDATTAEFRITVKPDAAPEQRCSGGNQITLVASD